MLKILDCTLRDGGYYNNWKFNDSLIKKYIAALIESRVDIVEIGFRFLPSSRDLGELAFSDDKYLNKLPLLQEIDVAVMINAKDFIESDLGIDISLNSVFRNKSDSFVDIVRIATHISDIKECKLVAKILSKLGYRVFLNLMQIDSIEPPVLKKALDQINKWNCIEVFYFADSFGNLNTQSIDRIINTIKSVWNGEIGIHAHDNKGHALVNSLSAVESGVSYVDATILGMGRGAGNTKMENLLVEVTEKNLGIYYPDKIFHLALKEFTQLQEQYKWGSSIYYYLSAVHGIHPTYIQEMMGDGRYSINQILSAITFLKDKVSSSYSLDNMMEALSGNEGSDIGSWSAKGWAKDREVLIIGSGPSVVKYFKEINQYIEAKNPLVLCLNINQDFPERLVDAYITCHETRIAIELDLYSDLTKPIILPLSRIPHNIRVHFSDIEILDFGLKIEKGSFSTNDKGCILNKPLVLIYALSLLSMSNTKKISFTGFDGYEDNSLKQKELNKAFIEFQENIDDINLEAITPTNLPINIKYLPGIAKPTPKVVIIIPARYDSSRLPGKPLINICGKSMINRTYEQCCKSMKEESVFVATDDMRIYNHCKELNMNVIMTPSDCKTGTDRVYEASKKIKADIYINVQGDEPIINPEDINTVISASIKTPDKVINAMCSISKSDFNNPTIPKVVTRPDKSLLYSSRVGIPVNKDLLFSKAKKQVCIYAFPKQSLKDFSRIENKTSLEELEDIEILRFLELGYEVQMVDVSNSSLAVDVSADIEKVEKILNA